MACGEEIKTKTITHTNTHTHTHQKTKTNKKNNGHIRSHLASWYAFVSVQLHYIFFTLHIRQVTARVSSAGELQ